MDWFPWFAEQVSSGLQGCFPRFVEQVPRGLFPEARAASRPMIATQGSWSKSPQDCFPNLCGARLLGIVSKVCGASLPRLLPKLAEQVS